MTAKSLRAMIVKIRFLVSLSGIALCLPAMLALADTLVLHESYLRDSETDRLPEVTEFPQYPSIARRDRIEGEATVCFMIDIRGKVKRVSVASYSHKIFRRPAIRAIKNSSFEPLRPDQLLAKSKACRTYRFRLEPVVSPST